MMLSLMLVTKCALIIVVLSECQIDPLRIQPTPLIFNKDCQIIYPNTIINQNDQIYIACPGNQLIHDNIALGDYIEVLCVDNEKLNFEGQDLNFYSLRCQDIPKNTIRYTQKRCLDGGQEVEIGYDIAANVFLGQMLICFDTVNLTPIYSYYNLTGNIGYRDSHVPRIFFQEDGFYATSDNLDNLYQRNNQRRTINGLLDLEPNSDIFIKRNGELFINRGHLAAKGDFVYAFQQLATFHYVNSAPQWASFNGGNWNELEISLRQYADSSKTDLEVYTGIYGITSLKNSRNGRATEMFLHAINGKNLIPVPQLFWKIIYDKNSGKGVAIVGVNNAYEFDALKDVICNDITKNISWFNNKLKRQKHDIQLGYVYACSISEFREIVIRSPVLNVHKLLL